MHLCCRRALGAILSICLLAAGAPAPAVTLEHVGTFIWRDSDPTFGGFSGIEISQDGTGFYALSDRAWLYWGNVQRAADGRITGMAIEGRTNLKDTLGRPLRPGYLGDSEGLAVGDDGTIWVSFEGLDRVASYATPDAPATRHRRPPPIPGVRSNTGLEGLAIRDDNQIIAIPEASADPDTPFPVMALQDNRWSKVGEIRRDPRWLMVAADFGPDGLLYVLERDFQGILGFSSRIRRMTLGTEGIGQDQIVLTTRPMQHDNMEGLSVWHDGQGIRLTLIADDNFLFVQRTEVAEYRLRE